MCLIPSTQPTHITRTYPPLVGQCHFIMKRRGSVRAQPRMNNKSREKAGLNAHSSTRHVLVGVNIVFEKHGPGSWWLGDSGQLRLPNSSDHHFRGLLRTNFPLDCNRSESGLRRGVPLTGIAPLSLSVQILRSAACFGDTGGSSKSSESP